jgi:hypothetical protein
MNSNKKDDIDMNRFTPTEKWEMPWFCNLSKNAQHLVCYLADKVDSAGFWEVNPRVAQFATRLTPEEFDQAHAELLDDQVDGKKHFIQHKGVLHFVDHLDWQCNQPLKLVNNAHRSIVKIEARRFDTTFYDCQAYTRPMIEDPISGDRIPVGAPPVSAPAAPKPEVKTPAPVPVVEVVAKSVSLPADVIAESAPTKHITKLSRAQLKNVPKDWDKIRQRCLGAMEPGFKFEPLFSVMAAWWDHCMAMESPYELPMWSMELGRMKEAAARHGGLEVIKKAVEYAISARMTTLNYEITAKVMRETVPTPANPRITMIGEVKAVEPKGWQAAVKTLYPDAQRIVRFVDLPRTAQERVTKHLNSL